MLCVGTALLLGSLGVFGPAPHGAQAVATSEDGMFEFDDSLALPVTEAEAGAGAERVVGIGNVDRETVVVATTGGITLAKHESLDLIENTMDRVWRWQPDDLHARIVAGPALHQETTAENAPTECFVADDSHRIYSISLTDGKTRWVGDMDPRNAGDTGSVQMRVDPRGRMLTVTAGDQIMVFSIDFGKVAFHRRIGPATFTGAIQFVMPPAASGATYKSKIILGDSKGVVHAFDLATGKRSWTWRFTGHALSPVVDIVRRPAADLGRGYSSKATANTVRSMANVDTIFAVSKTGGVVALRGDTATLLWSSNVGSPTDSTRMVSTPGGTGAFLDAKTLLLLSNDEASGALIHAVDVTRGDIKLWTMISGPGSVITGKIAVDRTIPLVYVVANGLVLSFDPSKLSMPSSQFTVGGLPSTGLTFAAERSEPCSYYVGTTEGEVRLVNFENFKEGSTACNFLTSESDSHEDRVNEAPPEDEQSDDAGADQPTKRELLAALHEVLIQPKPTSDDEKKLAADSLEIEVTADGEPAEEDHVLPGEDFEPAFGGDDDAESPPPEMAEMPPGEEREEPTIPEEVPCEDLEEQDEGPGEVIVEDGGKGTKGMEDEDWVSDEDYDTMIQNNERNQAPPIGA
eukprot:g3861.t1